MSANAHLAVRQALDKLAKAAFGRAIVVVRLPAAIGGERFEIGLAGAERLQYGEARALAAARDLAQDVNCCGGPTVVIAIRSDRQAE